MQVALSLCCLRFKNNEAIHLFCWSIVAQSEVVSVESLSLSCPFGRGRAFTHPLPQYTNVSLFAGCCFPFEDADGVSDPLIHLSSFMSALAEYVHNSLAQLETRSQGVQPAHPPVPDTTLRWGSSACLKKTPISTQNNPPPKPLACRNAPNPAILSFLRVEIFLAPSIACYRLVLSSWYSAVLVRAEACLRKKRNAVGTLQTSAH